VEEDKLEGEVMIVMGINGVNLAYCSRINHQLQSLERSLTKKTSSNAPSIALWLQQHPIAHLKQRRHVDEHDTVQSLGVVLLVRGSN
jgi:hypothetical protein